MAGSKGLQWMIGFFKRVWIVLCWLRRLAERDELNPLLKRAWLLTVEDLRFFLQLTFARLLVRLSLHRRHAREENLKRELEKRKRSIELRRMVKRPSVK
ncbi:MAG: hypothetical protein J2P41_16465 [Blastocatellia bacterium]|nr:hypothetical protein [Blastocatellia bacterium]